MNLEELKEHIARVKEQGGSGLYLVVTRDTAPRGNIRITGFGTGLLLNAREKDGKWHCTCLFKIEPIERNIARLEKDPMYFRKKAQNLP